MDLPEKTRPGDAAPGHTANCAASILPQPSLAGKPDPARGAVEWVPIDSLTVRAPFRCLWEPEDPDSPKIEAIAADMKRRGFDPAFPLVVWQHKYGRGIEITVLDGHTRLAAARKVGIQTVPVVHASFEEHHEAIDYAVHCQRDRRSITPAAILRCVRAIDKPRPGRPSKTTATAGVSAPPTTAQTAASLGVSEDTVQRARAIAEHGSPEVQKRVEDGSLSIAAGYAAVQAERNADQPQGALEATPAPQPEPEASPAAQDDELEPEPDQGERGELRCPFCGSGWVETHAGGNRKHGLAASVACMTCGAHGPTLTEWREERPPPDGGQWRRGTPDELKREAVDLWNRALRPHPQFAQGDYEAQLLAVASTRPKHAWPAIANAMEAVAKRLREGAAEVETPAAAQEVAK